MYALPAAIALALTMSSAAITPGPTTGVHPTPLSGTCPTGQFLSWVGTIYYSDAAETDEVGSCSITCRQFVNGDSPVFGGGGTCSGTSGPYEFRGVTCCPPRN